MNTEALTSTPQHLWSALEGYLLAHPPFAPVIAAFLGPTLAFLLSQLATRRQLNAATKKPVTLAKEPEGSNRVEPLDDIDFMDMTYVVDELSDADWQAYYLAFQESYRMEGQKLSRDYEQTEIDLDSDE
uniref:hypothetical protein n=1 Tax=Trichocoleus desertorum TaxID=1481672 RepID=UPI0025B50AF5|nr:hypothetical protein [Trichocoleus desertorum]